MQRKTASYEFNTKSLRNFIMEVVEKGIANRLIPFLSQAMKTHQTIDIQDILERFAFDNICNVAFNEDPVCLGIDEHAGSHGSDLFRAFDDATNLSAGRFMYAFPFMYRIKRFLNIGSERRLRESISMVHDLATKIIKSRRERTLQDNMAYDEDLLSRFMATHDGSDQFLRDIIISFILAGRDTTSSTLVWFFWLISSRRDVEQNILKEIAQIRAQNPECNITFTFDELREMHYLHASVCEALRLYPPVPVNSRQCLQDDILPDGTFVGEGWFLSYITYAMGRLDAIWGEDCRSFKPERWLKDGVFQPESSYKFPVFHAGPRICLGKEMAFIQMKSILACVMERFSIEIVDKVNCPEQVLSLTLRMKDGLQVRVRERSLDKKKKILVNSDL